MNLTIATNQKINFVAIKQGIRIDSAKGQGIRIDSAKGQDITSKVMVTIFSLLAKLERNLISERTKIALARVKQQGKKLGRPKGPGKSRLDGKEDEINGFLAKGVTKANIAKIIDVSWGTLDQFIKRKMTV